MKGTEHARTGNRPAILLGGTANALSVAWSLAPRGIPVFALNDPDSHVRYSRFSRYVPVGGEGNVQERWRRWLMGPEAAAVEGGLVLPCSDEGLELVARHRAELQTRYLVSEHDDAVLLAMLDKEQTYAIARRVGVPAPSTWSVRTWEELEAILADVPFPCSLKPRHSHLFQRHFGVKAFTVTSVDELRAAFTRVAPLGLEMIVTEIIPGGEDRYCSYYTYLDGRGEPLFHFTKRKPRQYPNGFGTGTYHVTDWNPEVKDLGLRLLQGAGVRGMGNPEFKRDPRDGRLKLIEVNSRFTGCNEILVKSGIDLPLLVYNRLTGRPLPPVGSYRTGVRVFVPLGDYLAFRQMRRRGEIGWGGWLRSLSHRPHLLYFRWRDPLPATAHAWHFLRAQVRKRLLTPPPRRAALGA
jgi:D-aspartate ligase